MDVRSCVLLSGALVLAGCGGGKAESAHDLTALPVSSAHEAAASEAVRASNAMGLGMLAELVAKEPDKNVCISPISISFCASMLRNGANDRADADLRKLLYQGSTKVEKTNEGLAALLTSFDPLADQATLNVANSLWLEESAPIVPAFVQTAKDSFRAEVANLSLQNPAALDRINGWVKDKTRGMIPKILDSMDSGAVAILVNAVALDAPWVKPLEGVGQKTFGGRGKAPFMTGDATGNNAGDRYSWASLRYKPGLQFIAILPKEGSPAKLLADKAIAKELADPNEKLSYSGEGVLELPKWTSDYKLDLKAYWQPRAPLLFDSGVTNFPKLTPMTPSWIAQALHKTHIEVDERGTKAAAATAIGVAAEAAPMEPFHLVLDRPFIYMIVEDTTKAILFVGVVQDPNKG